MSNRITYLGHATTWIQTGPFSLLTDPVFSDRIFFIRRQIPLPIKPEEMPEPTVLLISHAHYDHLDIPSFKYFSSRVPILIPPGLGGLFSKHFKNPLIEIPHGTTQEIVPGLKITAFPVKHFSFRLSGLTYRGANGYWIETNGLKIFFPGDTAYREDFKKFQQADLALLPVGPCRPEWLMRKRHLNSEEALRVFEEIGAKRMIPIHWGTFKLGQEPAEEPLEQLKKLIILKGLQDRVRILWPGDSLPLSPPLIDSASLVSVQLVR